MRIVIKKQVTVDLIDVPIEHINWLRSAVQNPVRANKDESVDETRIRKEIFEMLLSVANLE